MSAIVVHTERGSIVIEEGSGRCQGPGCKRIGGGMAKFTVSSTAHDDVEFVFCGSHLGRGLGAALLDEFKDRLDEIAAGVLAGKSRVEP